MPSRSAPKALIIDDDAVMRIDIQDCLEEAGFEVVEAAGGVEGLCAFEQYSSDIVLLDVSMPDMDGFTVCRRLRESELGAYVPILMITGNDDVQSVNAVQGFYFSRPLPVDAFSDWVRIQRTGRTVASRATLTAAGQR